MFIYFTGQSGFGNRMMTFVSGLWLCILAKIPKVIVFEEPCKWCPGSVNDVFGLPIHMRTVGIEAIRVVTLTNDNKGRLAWADDLCRGGKAVPFKMFHHPRFTPRYILAQMARKHVHHHVALPPMLWIQQKAVKIDARQCRLCEAGLHMVATVDRKASSINDPQLQVLGVHIRKTDMLDVMIRSKQTTRRIVDEQIGNLLWEVANEINNWTGTKGTIVILCADSFRGRQEATELLSEYCKVEFKMRDGRYTHIYSCSCVPEPDGTWSGTEACAQHQTFATGRAPADIGKLREGTVADFAKDMYMLSRAEVFASCEWSSVPELVRMLKGKPFRKDCSPRTGSP